MNDNDNFTYKMISREVNRSTEQQEQVERIMDRKMIRIFKENIKLFCFEINSEKRIKEHIETEL